MKNIIASLTAVLLVLGAVNAFAVTKEIQYNLEDQTNFGQLGVAGSAQPGNPGYISVSAPNYNNALFTYYLWVNGGGTLCIASYPTISAYSSFPSGNWNTQTMPSTLKGMGCSAVGSQS